MCRVNVISGEVYHRQQENEGPNSICSSGTGEESPSCPGVSGNEVEITAKELRVERGKAPPSVSQVSIRKSSFT